MASWILFDAFKAHVANGIHNLGSDSLKMALTATAPSKSADAQFANITEIAAGNGYSAGGEAVSVVSSEQSDGKYILVVGDVVFAAAGGSIGPWRYAVLYNDSAGNKEVIAYYDYTEENTILDTTNFPFNGSTNGIIELA